MIRHVIIFIVAIGIGALIALAVRSALHHPYAEHVRPGDVQQQPKPAAPPSGRPADPHAGHTTTTGQKPVNSICAICGMKPDPTITATYRGQLIAFGCKGCPEKFAKDPERYGPYFLRSEEAP